MIVKYGKCANGVFRGETHIKKMYKGGFGVIWDNPYNSETTRILMTNFPQKFVEICRYGNRHLQIVPFINEDPMLVCSLGIEGMPVRKLVGDGVAYLHINVEITTLDRYKIEIENRETVTSFQPFFDTETYAMACWLNSSNAVTTLTGSESGQFSCPKGNHIFEKVGGVWYVDGVQKQSKSLSEITYSGFWLFSWSRDHSRVNKGAMKEAIIGDEGNEKFVGFPFIRNGESGMIDTITGTFYPNANTSGSFTIEYTLQDGVTTWKPYT